MTIDLWRKILRENITSLPELCNFLELDEMQSSELEQNTSFRLNLPSRLAKKIQKRTLEDPILRQFVPFKVEKNMVNAFHRDPVGDCQAARTPKFLQKYSGRALLLVTGACAMHCRYCFRQKYAYTPLQEGFAKEIAWIQKDGSIKEIILSGGDPLSLGNESLQALISALAEIQHIKRIRFHTRFPIGIPERIDAGFLAILEKCTKQIWFVIHCNHVIELDSDVLDALKKIQKLGIPVLNQWVLLRGVNDSVEELETLCEKLIDYGIFPYYLHQLDKVEGAAHFEVAKENGKLLIQELQKRMAGYGVPKYVQEVPLELSKTRIL
jgi:EF-P beta-lysylation protein EpmB